MNVATAATGKNGVVATGDAYAAGAALTILDQGGNAADAAAAALLVLSVTSIGATCLGGEVPIIVYNERTAGIQVLAGLGAAPLEANGIAWYLQHGTHSSDITVAAVPALMDACITLLHSCGSMSFEQVAQPVLEVLRKGRPSWYTDTALQERLDALTGKQVTAAELLMAENSRWSTQLATTLAALVRAEQLATGGRQQGLIGVRERFYRGDIAQDLAQWYAANGAFLRAHDLAGHGTPIEEPVVAEYRGYKVHKCGPWTQGPWLLQALKVLEGFDIANMDTTSADYIHTVTEAMKLCLADRDHYYGDPLFNDIPVNELISNDYAQLRRGLIHPGHSTARPLPGDPRAMRPTCEQPNMCHSSTNGTTVCIVADRNGNIVVATPSGCGSTAGSGGRTGVTHGTRLRNFNSTAKHPNCIGPGKRPSVTLSPTLVTKHGKPVLALSVTSGDLQDQVALQRIIDFVDFSNSIYDSARALRFYTGRLRSAHDGHCTDDLGLFVPGHIEPTVTEELARRGHRIKATSLTVGQAAVSMDRETGVAHAMGNACGAL